MEAVPGMPKDGDALTLQELRCLEFFATGEETKEIARIVGSDENTIQAIEKSVMMKLGATNRSESVIAAFERGLLDTSPESERQFWGAD